MNYINILQTNLKCAVIQQKNAANDIFGNFYLFYYSEMTK